MPDSFWRHIYNIGGGASTRVINHKFMTKSDASMGITDFRKAFHPNWFATRNVHGRWYADSDRLEALVPFHNESIDDFMNDMKRNTPLLLNHGYDETKARGAWLLSDMRDAAAFLGDGCLSDHFDGPFILLAWRCALSHEFAMSPNLMRAGGHWCPSCMMDPGC